MSDPTRSSVKLHEDVSSTSSAQLLLFPAQPLVFSCFPGHGRPSYEVDLTEFANGRNYKGNKPWCGNFTGRPQLAMELAGAWRSLWGSASEESKKGHQHEVRSFCRFLDSYGSEMPVSSIADLTDSHGAAFKIWLADNNIRSGVLKNVRTLLVVARELKGLPPLYWPSLRHATSHNSTPDVPPETVRQIFGALVQEAKNILGNFEEGAKLAARGEDPRGRKSSEGFKIGNWEHRKNHAWLIRHLCGEIILDKRQLLGAGGCGLNNANRPDQHHPGALHLAPGQSRRASEGFVGKLRWLYPSFHDTAVFLLLFLIGTGWNLSTALNLDVSGDDWWEPNEQKPGWVQLKSLKPRSTYYQHAGSREGAEFEPQWIIKLMIERTAGLRRRLEADIAEIDERLRASPGDMGLLRHRARLSAQTKSPWLFHWLDKVGQVSAIEGKISQHVADVLTATIVRHRILEAEGRLAQVSPSDFRDTWAAHVFQDSGYNLVTTQLALGHANLRVLRDYLKTRRWKQHSERRFRKFQNAVMHEIRERKILDGAALRILVDRGEITEAQRARLADWRKRTRIGMGCLDPYNPPTEIAPDHKPGRHCRVQTCTLCSHGRVFRESLDGIAMRFAELILIQEQVPIQSWEESDWPDEKMATEYALGLFDPVEVERAVGFWINEIRTNEIPLFEHLGIDGNAQ